MIHMNGEENSNIFFISDTFCRKSGHIRFGKRGELGHFRQFGTPILPLFMPNNRCPYGMLKNTEAFGILQEP